MATYSWYGNTTDSEGEFEEVANWRDAVGAASAEYPGENQADDIIFDGQAAVDLSAEGNGATAQADMDQTGSSSKNGITDLTVKDGFTYGIGGPRCPLILEVEATPAWRFNSNDHSDIYIVSVGGTVASFEVLKTNSNDDALHLAFADNAATAGRIVSGNVTFDAELGGQTASGIGTLIVDGDDANPDPVVIIDCAVSTNLIVRSGTVYWRKGTLTQLEVYGGEFSARRSTTGPTLTDALVYGGTADLRTSGADLTITNAIEYFGGTVKWNPGQTIDFT